MKKKLTLALAAGALLVPAQQSLAANENSGHGDKHGCKNEREADPAAFAEKYGKNGMRECKREYKAAKKERKAARKAAKRECKAEAREIGKDEFRATYGNEDGEDAKKNCVAAKLQPEPEPEPEVEPQPEPEGDGGGTFFPPSGESDGTIY